MYVCIYTYIYIYISLLRKYLSINAFSFITLCALVRKTLRRVPSMKMWGLSARTRFSIHQRSDRGDFCKHDWGFSKYLPLTASMSPLRLWGRPTCCMLRGWTSRLGSDSPGRSSSFISRRRLSSCISVQAIIVWLRWQNGPWVQQRAGGCSY